MRLVLDSPARLAEETAEDAKHAEAKSDASLGFRVFRVFGGGDAGLLSLSQPDAVESLSDILCIVRRPRPQAVALGDRR